MQPPVNHSTSPAVRGAAGIGKNKSRLKATSSNCHIDAAGEQIIATRTFLYIFFLHKFNLGNGWGGSASMLKALSGALSDLGHRVGAATARYPDPFGITTVELPLGCDLTFGPEKRAGERTLDELSTEALQEAAEKSADRIAAKIFAEQQPDLLVANHINLMALASWHLNRRFHVPYRIISNGTDTKLLLRDARYRSLFGEAARDADRIFTISGYVAGEVKASVGGRIDVLGGAVDPRLFCPAKAPFGDSKTLIYVGRLVTEKGLWPLLEAFERQHSAAKLKIVGEGPLRSELEARVRERGLQGRVELAGFIPHERLRAELIGAAAAVVPSIWQEPLGLVVLEALACGLPVIASAVGGIPEMVRDGENGLLVPPGDASLLAAAIDRVVGDAAFHRRMRDGVARTVVPSYRDLAQRLIA
jgi:glycosyltransferase involved in cell wall biosynthesis